MGNIFINYRRADTSGAAGRLYDRLEDHFGKDHIFMDVDQIAGGVDFVDELQAQLSRTNVLLAIIGPNWLTLSDEMTGEPRIFNPKDFVRIEIENALVDEIEIIPVLVDGAAMPRPEDLPDSLKLFTRRNAMRLTHERFRADSQGLIKSIEAAFKRVSERQKTKELKEKEEFERKKSKEEEERREQARQEAIAGLNSDQIAAAEAVANWEFIKESEDPEDFRNHIARYDMHEASMKWANMRLEELIWQDCKRQPKKETLIAYLEEFPQGRHAEIASDLLKDIKKEETIKIEKERDQLKETAAWNTVRDTDDIHALERFISNFPNGKYEKEAKRLLTAMSRKNFLSNRKWRLLFLISLLSFVAVLFVYQKWLLTVSQDKIKEEVLKSALCRGIDNYTDCEETNRCEWLLNRNICEAKGAISNSTKFITPDNREKVPQSQTQCSDFKNYTACELKNKCVWDLLGNNCLERKEKNVTSSPDSKEKQFTAQPDAQCVQIDNYNDCEATQNCEWRLSSNLCFSVKTKTMTLPPDLKKQKRLSPSGDRCLKIDNYNDCEVTQNCEWRLSSNLCFSVKTKTMILSPDLKKQKRLSPSGDLCLKIDNYNDCEAIQNCEWILSRNLCFRK